MTFSDWVSLSSPVCWILGLCWFLNRAVRAMRAARPSEPYRPRRERPVSPERCWEGDGLSYCEADDVRADANLRKATADWRDSIVEFTPEQQEAMWQRIRSRVEPPPASLPFGSLGNPVLTPLGDKAYWGRLSDFTGERDE